MSLSETHYRHINGGDKTAAKGAFVGLAPPGDLGSWQRECKVPIYFFFLFLFCQIHLNNLAKVKN